MVHMVVMSVAVVVSFIVVKMVLMLMVGVLSFVKVVW